MIHRYWLERFNIDGTYEREAVRPDAFEDFLRSLAERGYVGANVTLPHKEAALRAADRPDAAASAIGAANTLWLDEAGKLHASNTDAYGFMTNLEDEAPQWNTGRRPVVVLGAGGAARAILYGLISAGATRILLCNRSAERAKDLAHDFGPVVEAVRWEDRNRVLAGCRLLVNATSLGMTGQGALDVELAALPSAAVVADIVYSPMETRLLAAARARGNAAVDGLGMLLHQAVPGFERWFGVRPEVTPDLKAHVAATLGAG
jgi:shikimate dehydrogenase